MAAVTDRVVDLYDGEVYVDATYDDVTLLVSTVLTHNSTGARAGRVRVTDAPTGVVLLDQPVPVGDKTYNVTSQAKRIDQLNIYATA